MSRLLADDRSADRGAAAVEFALVLMLLVTLVFGIVEFGRAYNAQITLTHAAREGVRVLALGTADPVGTAQAAAAPLVIGVTAGTCTDPGEPVTLTTTYTFDFAVPMFGGSIPLTGEAVMRCGG